MAFTFFCITALFGALMYLTIYYATRRRWTTYPAGRVLMYLIWALDALIGYALISQFIDDRDLRRHIYEGLILVLTIAVLMIAETIRREGVGLTKRRKMTQEKEHHHGD
ncbi:membrane protein [Arthrobacter phage EastWest]|uniref:Membrane protein n=1 Tax=Arthrobacter phage EastWest TaxID=2894292 RepID=A0AAE8YK44_9CAUD|nr:membrane protein [Arthrobacter phage EastWest]